MSLSSSHVGLLFPFLSQLFLLLLLVLSCGPFTSFAGSTVGSGVCLNSTSSSSLNALGCQLSSFALDRPLAFGAVYDSFAQPNRLLVLISGSSVVEVWNVDGSGLYAQLSLPSYSVPSSIAVDDFGFVFVTAPWLGHNGGLFVFSPFPNYTAVAQIPLSGAVSGVAVAVVPQGEYLYMTALQLGVLYTFRLTFNGSIPNGVTAVGSLPIFQTPSLSPPSASVSIHPLTKAVCVYDPVDVLLTVYTANYTNPFSPVLTSVRSLNRTNSALSALYGSYPSLSAITTGGVFVMGMSAVSLDIGVGPVFVLLMNADGSFFPTTSPGLLVMPTYWSSQVPATPLLAVPPNGSLLFLIQPGQLITSPLYIVNSNVMVMQGVTGLGVPSTAVNFTVFVDFNSSLQITGTMPSASLLYSPSVRATSYSFTDSPVIGNGLPGSLNFSIGLLVTGNFDYAYPTFYPLPSGLTMQSSSLCAYAILNGDQGPNTLQCNYSLSWTASVSGAFEVLVNVDRGIFGSLWNSNDYYITIPFTGPTLFFSADSQLTVPLLLANDSSTSHSYSATAPLTSLVSTYHFSIYGVPLDSSDVVYLGIPASVTFTSLTNNVSACNPRQSTVAGLVTLTSNSSSPVTQCDYQLSWSTPFDAQLAVLYTAQRTTGGVHLYDTVTIFITFASNSTSSLNAVRLVQPVLSWAGLKYSAPLGVSVSLPQTLTDTAGSALVTLSWNGDGANVGFALPSANNVTLTPISGSPALCSSTSNNVLSFGYFQSASSCTFIVSWPANFNGGLTLGSLDALQLMGSAADGSFVLPFISPQRGQLCVLMYGLPSSTDYPFSIATTLSFSYFLNPVTTARGRAFSLLKGSGQRTYTNRFGNSFTVGLTLTSPLSNTSNLLYVNNSFPVDSSGLMWNLSTLIQLPGVGPSSLFSLLRLYNSSLSGLLESNSTLIDSSGTAFLSSVPGFINSTLPPSNINALAVNYAACSAPISFVNGLRPPTQPSASNGAARFSYSYSLSDGATYSVQTNLTISTTSAFAFTADMLGNPYQSITNITGTRLYTYLPTGLSLLSTVTGIANVSSACSVAPSSGLSQRFYPYNLLGASPGVYTINTAPFIDAQGLSFAVNPPTPVNGLPTATTLTSTTVNVFLRTALPTTLSPIASTMLSECPTLTFSPSAALQTQAYSIS